MKLSTLFILSLFWSLATISVSAQKFVTEPLIHDSTINSVSLPSLDAFIQSAISNSPILKASDQEIAQITESIKKEKKSWADFITIDGNTRYGLYNTINITDATGTTADAGSKASKQQLNYYGGLTLRMPLSVFLGKKNQLKMLSMSMEETKYRKEQLRNDLILVVIDEYYKLIRMEKSIHISQNVVQSVRLDFMKAEKDVESGLITLGEYNHALEVKEKAEENYNTAINDFMSQYMKIQVLTGLKLNAPK